MSSFLVSLETIRLCVEAMSESENVYRMTELGNKLIKLNQDALMERYGASDDYSEDYVHTRSKYPPSDKITRLKALECLLYQCSEGDVPETKLYKEIKEAIYHLRGDIIHSMTEYDRAPWCA